MPRNSTKSIFLFLSFTFPFLPPHLRPFSARIFQRKQKKLCSYVSLLPNTLKPRISFSSFSFFLGSPLSPSILNICFAAFLVHKPFLSKQAFSFCRGASNRTEGGKSELLEFCLVFTLANETECEKENTCPQRVHRQGRECVCLCAERES